MSFRKKLLIVGVLAVVAQPAFALTTTERQKLYESEVVDVDRNSRFYYKIGGSRPLNYPATNYENYKIGGQLKFGAGYSCGNFDPFLSFDEFFQDLDADKIMNYAESTITGMISGLPMLYLQRNHPDIYQLFQTNVYRAEELFKMSSKSCEQIEAEIASGKNPYKDWEFFGMGDNLQEKTQSETPSSATAVVKEVKAESGDKGVDMPVPGKGIRKVGGKDQDAIDMVRIGATAGYNTMLQRPATAINEPNTTTQTSTELYRIFKEPEELELWLKDTLGFEEIFITDEPKYTPDRAAGKGLLTQASMNQSNVHESLSIAINTRSSDERDKQLAKLGTSGLFITEDFANRINNSSAKPLIVDALAGEIALNMEIDKALIARRALIASMSEPNIGASKVAKENIEKIIAELEKEIERAMFEYRLRKELVSDLANEVYELPEKTLNPLGVDPSAKSPTLQ